jgi:chain length determinant protein EpsF
MSFYQFLSVLRARWGVALASILACVLVSQILTLRAPKLYTALASVVVNTKLDPVAAAAYPGASDSNEMETQTDIVTSPRVAERVVKELGFDEDPVLKRQWLKTTAGHGDFVGWLAGGLQRSISVPPPRDSYVISISATWDNAKDAARIANAFAQAYIDTTIELRVEPAKQYATWFDERAKALRSDLEAKQKLLSDYQDKEGIVSTDEKLDVEMARLAELSSQLVAVQTQRADSRSRELEAVTDNDAVPEVLQSQLIASLKAQLLTAQAREQDLRTQLGVNHPEYQRIEAEITSLQSSIEQQRGQVVRSMRTATQVNARRENALSAAIDAQKKRVLEVKHERDYASILQNDVVTAQRNFDTVTQGLAQTSLESHARQANAVQLTRATEPAAPSTPKVMRNLALGLAFGFALSIASALCLEMMDQRVRRDAELPQLLGVPLLATFNSRTNSNRLPGIFGSIVSKAIDFKGDSRRRLSHEPSPS